MWILGQPWKTFWDCCSKCAEVRYIQGACDWLCTCGTKGISCHPKASLTRFRWHVVDTTLSLTMANTWNSWPRLFKQLAYISGALFMPPWLINIYTVPEMFCIGQALVAETGDIYTEMLSRALGLHSSHLLLQQQWERYNSWWLCKVPCHFQWPVTEQVKLMKWYVCDELVAAPPPFTTTTNGNPVWYLKPSQVWEFSCTLSAACHDFS